MAKFYVIDTETPNMQNDRICSIAITTVDNGIIKETKHWFVNPECHFDQKNIGIHHITPDIVKDAITFDKLWDEIGDCFRNNVIVAHSAASADLNFIKKTLLSYGIAEKPIRFFCTYQWSCKLFPEMTHHRLNDMCEHFGISLDHHDAESDSRACAELLLKIMEQNINPARRFRYYEMDKVKDSQQDFAEPTCADDNIDIPFDESHYYNIDTIKDKTVCVTGDFEYGDRKTVTDLLIKQSARIVTAVSGKVNVVLVGTKGSEAWSHGNYGSKIEDALKFIEKGKNISIIKECDFFDR